MYIFDRWGNLIFKSFDQKNDKWNGTVNNQGKPDEAIIDVYDYLIRVKELYGPKHQYIGRVTILK
jgi:gliding motility-associated-like protein